VQNREIRRICEHFGLSVNRLVRVGYGPWRLRGIPNGSALQVPVPRWLAVAAGRYAAAQKQLK